MTILFLCPETDLVREVGAYANAFRRRGIRVAYIDGACPLNVDLEQLFQRCPERPDLVLHVEWFPVLPPRLAETPIPTASFQVDTYAYTRRRIAWSMLFDHVFVFHPAYEQAFREAGHPAVYELSHAAEAELFAGQDLERIFEVGWVGQVGAGIYRTRERLLRSLAASFQMNDWRRRYSQQEMARIYLQSRIVVNIGRDDFLQDANLRVFEAMAAGALLITRLPSELTQIGFQEGVHFVGYRETRELQPLIRKYLADESSRRLIAHLARELVLREHTYDRRADVFLDKIRLSHGKLSAPARGWPGHRVHLAYLDFFAAHGSLHLAAAELPKIARHNLKNAIQGAVLLARAFCKKLWLSMRSRD